MLYYILSFIDREKRRHSNFLAFRSNLAILGYRPRLRRILFTGEKVRKRRLHDKLRGVLESSRRCSILPGQTRNADSWRSNNSFSNFQIFYSRPIMFHILVSSVSKWKYIVLYLTYSKGTARTISWTNHHRRATETSTTRNRQAYP